MANIRPLPEGNLAKIEVIESGAKKCQLNKSELAGHCEERNELTEQRNSVSH